MLGFCSCARTNLTSRVFAKSVAQWIERSPGVRKVVNSNPVMGSDFFPSTVGLKKKTEVRIQEYFKEKKKT